MQEEEKEEFSVIERKCVGSWYLLRGHENNSFFFSFFPYNDYRQPLRDYYFNLLHVKVHWSRYAP
jgi:hypothetical protein